MAISPPATRSLSQLPGVRAFASARFRLAAAILLAVLGVALNGVMLVALWDSPTPWLEDFEPYYASAVLLAAGESAYFRAAGINNGLTATELGLSFLLPRAIGSSRAFEFMLSGRDIDAAEAAAMGLVSRTVPDAELLDEALDLADRINGWSTQGTALTKRAMWAGLETASLRAAIEMETHTQLFVRMTTKNFEEAVRARKENRPAVFED